MGRNFNLILVVVLTFSFSNILAQNMVLSGASSTNVNGIYINMGTNASSGGVDYYQRESIYIYLYGGTWIAGEELGSTSTWTIYYYEAGTSQNTPEGLNLSSIGKLGVGPSTPDVDGAALPVELTVFSGSISNGSVLLGWQTATEVNNYGFQVERKLESEWKRIGFVNGHGNSNSPKEYSFIDLYKISGSVKYRLKQIDIDGSFKYSDVIEIVADLPINFELSQNYPNPFNPKTTINYTIPQNGFVEIRVYDLLGHKIASLVNKEQKKGNYAVEFNASKIASGTYFYSLQSGSFIETKKLSLLQ